MKMAESEPPVDPFSSIHRRREIAAPDLNKVPLYPDEDLLIFIRDHNRQLSRVGKGSLDHRP